MISMDQIDVARHAPDGACCHVGSREQRFLLAAAPGPVTALPLELGSFEPCHKVGMRLRREWGRSILSSDRVSAIDNPVLLCRDPLDSAEMKARQKVREPMPIPIVKGSRILAGTLPAQCEIVPKRTADPGGERKRIHG